MLRSTSCTLDAPHHTAAKIKSNNFTHRKNNKIITNGKANDYGGHDIHLVTVTCAAEESIISFKTAYSLERPPNTGRLTPMPILVDT